MADGSTINAKGMNKIESSEAFECASCITALYNEPESGARRVLRVNQIPLSSPIDEGRDEEKQKKADTPRRSIIRRC